MFAQVNFLLWGMAYFNSSRTFGGQILTFLRNISNCMYEASRRAAQKVFAKASISCENFYRPDQQNQKPQRCNSTAELKSLYVLINILSLNRAI